MTLWTLLIGIIAICCSVIVKGETVCSESRRITNWPACQSALSLLLNDNSKYFYGTSYANTCPVNARDGIDCFTYVPVPPHSIMARMSMDGSQRMSTANINRWLELKYNAPVGEYTGCDFNHKDTGGKQWSVDPLNDNVDVPWETREQPQITWSTSEDSPGTLYTLLFQDVGIGFTHSLWMNIQGNDLSTATVIRPYAGPGNPREAQNLYAFFLFKQSARVAALSQSWQEVMANMNDPAYLQRRWGEFMGDNGLSGPIAVNWMSVTGDPYSSQRLADLGLLQNCAFYVNRALQSHRTRDFLPRPFQLSVFMRVNFQSTALTANICCDTFDYPAEDVYTDPIGSGMIKAATARTGTSVTVTLHKNKRSPNDETDFVDEYYTLIMVDPDVPSPTYGTNEQPLIHWLVINAPNGRISRGSELHSYRGPRPPNQEPHTYYFLLYKHNQGLPLNVASTSGYTSGCDRCRFDLTRFTAENNLALVGASWMKSQNDAYVNMTRIQEGGDKALLCAGVSAYEDPCVNSAYFTGLSGALFIGVVLLFVIG